MIEREFTKIDQFFGICCFTAYYFRAQNFPVDDPSASYLERLDKNLERVFCVEIWWKNFGLFRVFVIFLKFFREL